MLRRHHLREPTALCCGIPRAGVRVRAVQSSQNPEKAPGFTRAAVGETPRNSRIRLSPNILSSRKGQSAVQRLVRGALARSLSLPLCFGPPKILEGKKKKSEFRSDFSSSWLNLTLARETLVTNPQIDLGATSRIESQAWNNNAKPRGILSVLRAIQVSFFSRISTVCYNDNYLCTARHSSPRASVLMCAKCAWMWIRLLMKICSASFFNADVSIYDLMDCVGSILRLTKTLFAHEYLWELF